MAFTAIDLLAGVIPPNTTAFRGDLPFGAYRTNDRFSDGSCDRGVSLVRRSAASLCLRALLPALMRQLKVMPFA
jgi:hypothetical protein